MTPEDRDALRAPFPEGAIGKLPRLWCADCRKDRRKHCDRHESKICKECGNKHSVAALHLDYVGHADTTDRLLSVDPAWSWEPMALDDSGLPRLDSTGGLWIRLTVCDVTRPGYGSADGKSGGDAIKEAIGDAIRNAAMRFGVALDMWRKGDAADWQSQRDSVNVSAPPTTRGSSGGAAKAREDLWHVAQAKGMTMEDVAAEFYQWSQGKELRDAKADDVRQYMATIESTTMVQRSS